MTQETYVVQDAMDAKAIAVVLDVREALDHKFSAADITPELYRIAVSYVRGYRGTSDYVRDVRVRYEQYGRLFDAQAAGCLNWMVGEVRGAITRAVRDEVTVPRAEHPFTVPNGTYTVVDPVHGKHWTLKLEDRFGEHKEGDQMISYLAGPDNERDYVGFAFVWARDVRMWKRFADNFNLVHMAQVLLNMDNPAYRDAGLRYAIASGRCWRCGRTLTVPASVMAGLGPECAKVVGYGAVTKIDVDLRSEYVKAQDDLPPENTDPKRVKWAAGKRNGTKVQANTDLAHADARGPRPVNGELFSALDMAEKF